MRPDPNPPASRAARGEGHRRLLPQCRGVRHVLLQAGHPVLDIPDGACQSRPRTAQVFIPGTQAGHISRACAPHRGLTVWTRASPLARVVELGGGGGILVEHGRGRGSGGDGAAGASVASAVLNTAAPWGLAQIKTWLLRRRGDNVGRFSVLTGG